MFFLEIYFALFTPQVQIIHENVIKLLFFLSKNGIFTLLTSSSSSIYKIVIAIDTPTTMNNQFEAFNAPKIDLHFLFLNSYELKTTYLYSFSIFIKKRTQDFDSKIFMVHRAIEFYDSWWVTFV